MVDTATTPQTVKADQILLVACNACGQAIKGNDHCGEGCEYSGMPEEIRPKETVEVRVYVFDRTTSFVPCWGCNMPIGGLCLCDI